MIDNDLAVARKLLTEESVLVVDDFFNPLNPQITEFLFRYLGRNPYDSRPFLLGFDIAYLRRPAAFYDHHRLDNEMAFDGMQQRDVDMALTRSANVSDANIFSMIDNNPKHGQRRGPDWDQGRMQVVTKPQAC